MATTRNVRRKRKKSDVKSNKEQKEAGWIFIQPAFLKLLGGIDFANSTLCGVHGPKKVGIFHSLSLIQYPDVKTYKKFTKLLTAY